MNECPDKYQRYLLLFSGFLCPLFRKGLTQFHTSHRTETLFLRQMLGACLLCQETIAVVKNVNE